MTGAATADAAGLVHATVVARRRGGADGGWGGALLMGPSGAGKSDLALRLTSGAGWRLVADDYAHVWASGGALYAAAPATIAGRMEVRGLGLIERPRLSMTRIVLAVGCVAHPPERLPGPATLALCGVEVRHLALQALHPSAPAWLDAAMEALGQARALDY